jgi:hypothetical protein
MNADPGDPRGEDAGADGTDGDVQTNGTPPDETTPDADTFGVGIHVTEDELRFVVHVPSSIDSGWTDPEAFQRLVERVVWTHLDRESTLWTVASAASTGETVTLGTVTLRPDETVVDHSLSPPAAGSASSDATRADVEPGERG